MNIPKRDDYIDVHTHHVTCHEGVFAVENLMAHENIDPKELVINAFTAGIHPWNLTTGNRETLITYIRAAVNHPDLIAVGEAGFDKFRGPSLELQRSTFEEQVRIAEEYHKPVIIHCVRAWDELLASHKKLKPSTAWMIHGFRGKKELASQLLSRGMYISIWFEFALRPESADLLRFLPKDRIFLETDGADADIKEIYRKAASDLNLNVEELKSIIVNNFIAFFGK